MIQTGAKNGGGLGHEPAPHSQKEGHSHPHVELVIARILAKQHAYMKERPFRQGDLEKEDKDWYRH